MRDDRLTVLGLTLLAGLAWAAPLSLRFLKDSLRPPPASIVERGPTAPLLWSPAPVATSSRSAPPASRPVGGWQGLLLGQPLDLNAATLEDLQALPRVGPKTAAAILAARQERGRFSQVDDLLEVRGIGPKTLERLRPLVRTGQP